MLTSCPFFSSFTRSGPKFYGRGATLPSHECNIPYKYAI